MRSSKQRASSSVKRRFSINKKLLVENLEELSLASQRIVYDYFTSLGVTVHKYHIPNDLAKSCKGVHTRYVAAMDSKKAECGKTKKERKRKLTFDEIAELKWSRESTESCVATLSKDIIKYSFEAEEKSDNPPYQGKCPTKSSNWKGTDFKVSE